MWEPRQDKKLVAVLDYLKPLEIKEQLEIPEEFKDIISSKDLQTMPSPVSIKFGLWLQQYVDSKIKANTILNQCDNSCSFQANIDLGKFIVYKEIYLYEDSSFEVLLGQILKNQITNLEQLRLHAIYHNKDFQWQATQMVLEVAQSQKLLPADINLDNITPEELEKVSSTINIEPHEQEIFNHPIHIYINQIAQFKTDPEYKHVITDLDKQIYKKIMKHDI